MNIGPRLKLAREAIGYTQAKAAKESGIGESSISEFENSTREPRFSQLSRLANAYKKSVDFFLAEDDPVQDSMLWRDPPSAGEQMKEIEAEFRQLCENYQRLEDLLEQTTRPWLPDMNANSREFNYGEATRLASDARTMLSLGDIPSTSLKRVLEERLHVKVFYLSFSGSAISTISPKFGPAVLLNRDSKQWRRNYDLAHELFHLLTWKTFRTAEQHDAPTALEEKLANTFASALLLPAEPLQKRMDSVFHADGKVGLGTLDEIAREFDVSLEALLWRMVSLYRMPAERITEYVDKARQMHVTRPERKSDTPDLLPERYCSLAIRALREGLLSLMKFARYMNISYREAEEYLAAEEDFRDEQISISIA